MKSKYEAVFEDYAKSHSINPSDYSEHLKEYGYLRFFNYITESCLGIAKTQQKNTPRTASSLIYLADIAKEKYIADVDVVCVTNLYPGILTNGDILFNYPDYDKFLITLFELRKEIKKKYIQEKIEIQNIKQLLIKQYLNLVYGAIDNDNSILSSDMKNVRQFIVSQAKSVMLNVASFFLNKSIPMFYINTDELFVPRMDKEMFDELMKHYMETCGELINTDISTPFLDREEPEFSYFVIFSNKKKYIFGTVSTIKTTSGIPLVDHQKVLAQNKAYFGRNFHDIFPEYAI